MIILQTVTVVCLQNCDPMSMKIILQRYKYGFKTVIYSNYC